MATVRRAATAALAAAARDGSGLELSVLLADDDAVRALNHRFRGKDRPTNVLSFPVGNDGPVMAGGEPRPLGDVVLAYETVAGEAIEQHKAMHHHVSHLVIHGILHLLGYDHDNDDDADQMEACETTALAAIGMPDPYRPQQEEALTPPPGRVYADDGNI